MEHNNSFSLKRKYQKDYCKFFAIGECKKLEECEFSHDFDNSLSQSFDNYYNSAKEQKIKTKKCRFFEKGICRSGESCPFIHQLNSHWKNEVTNSSYEESLFFEQLKRSIDNTIEDKIVDTPSSTDGEHKEQKCIHNTDIEKELNKLRKLNEIEKSEEELFFFEDNINEKLLVALNEKIESERASMTKRFSEVNKKLDDCQHENKNLLEIVSQQTDLINRCKLPNFYNENNGDFRFSLLEELQIPFSILSEKINNLEKNSN
ncbi:hypothetical protein HK099_004469 [Clydaea vesicula]|uniref:C3H1-type domain-containing protein n=1 Tax=Clydaea vesicula TaxID=447962 RepID=A0AAD5U522_9FUNG|nr:hypothetical protein HK099_004469 [Clydaea vesicula]KAJ3397739.1 hypothetical protein HDU92_004155 [Lobulomyces angularis]